MEKRTQIGTTTEMHHIYSHLLDNKNPDKRKIETMKTKYPDNWKYLLEYNQKVEKLAQTTTNHIVYICACTTT